MPGYYNPYNFYPVSYANQMGYNTMPTQQSTSIPSQVMQPPQLKAMEWVDGEVGAKAFQMPPGWPANQPIVLWDSTDTVIWLKSWGPMGIPNPMQKLKYILPEQQNQPNLMSGSTESNTSNQVDVSRFATKEDISNLREEIRQMTQRSISRNTNQNGSNNGSNIQGGQNRGGNT